MYLVEITGWHKGLEKVSHTEALLTLAGMSLADAKAKTDIVLEGGTVEVPVETKGQATALVNRLNEIGAIASFKNNHCIS